MGKRTKQTDYTVKIKNSKCNEHDDCVEVILEISKDAWEKLQEKSNENLTRFVLITL